MVIVNDGQVGPVGQLVSGSHDSNNKPLNFKLDEKTGSYTADGSDGKRYYVDMQNATGKISVADIEEMKKRQEEAAKAAPTTTTSAKK